MFYKSVYKESSQCLRRQEMPGFIQRMLVSFVTHNMVTDVFFLFVCFFHVIERALCTRIHI